MRYMVRVIRRYAEDYCDLEIEAQTPLEAQTLAINEAKQDVEILFMPLDEPDFDADEPEEIEDD